jgi:hypothetical protein
MVKVCIEKEAELYPETVIYEDDEGTEIPDEMWIILQGAEAALKEAKQCIIEHVGRKA